MTMTERRYSAVQKQVEAYRDSEEAWQNDHEALKECWALEDAIAVGLSCNSLIEKVTEAWRERVYRGTESADSGVNAFHLMIHEVWLSATEGLIALVEDRVEKIYNIEKLEELRSAFSRVKSALKNWVEPQISTLVGLREITLTPQAAAELDRILDEAKINPPPPIAPRIRQLTSDEFKEFRSNTFEIVHFN